MTAASTRRALFALIFAAGLCGWAVFDREPAIPQAVPDAATASAARALFDRARDAGTGFQPVSASAAEVSAAAALAARAAGLARTRTAIEDGSIVSRASIAAPLGLWVNLEGRIAADEAGRAEPSGRIGNVPVPPWLAHGLVWAVREWFARPGQQLPAIDAIVRDLKIGPTAVFASLKIPPNSASLAALAQADAAPIDGAITARIYCRLVVAQREQPIVDLGRLVRSAFATKDRNPEANRAALVAVAMVAVSPKAGRLAGPGVEEARRCSDPTAPVTLHNRDDLAKHWALSAALAAAFGADASSVAGIWKELSDSMNGGSGFSYVDLAADRSGTMLGDRAARASTALPTAQWLAKADDDRLLPMSQLALAEGMTETEFTRRFGTIDGARHRAIVGRIDATILKTLTR